MDILNCIYLKDKTVFMFSVNLEPGTYLLEVDAILYEFDKVYLSLTSYKIQIRIDVYKNETMNGYISFPGISWNRFGPEVSLDPLVLHARHQYQYYVVFLWHIILIISLLHPLTLLEF